MTPKERVDQVIMGSGPLAGLLCDDLVAMVANAEAAVRDEIIRAVEGLPIARVLPEDVVLWIRQWLLAVERRRKPPAESEGGHKCEAVDDGDGPKCGICEEKFSFRVGLRREGG